MAIITLPGNTLGCCIGTGSFEGVGKAFSNAKTTTNSLRQSISGLRSKVDAARAAANVDTAHSHAQNSEKRESEKESALTAGYSKLEEFISDVDAVDAKSAKKIRERKNDFYAKYSYLKPDCEKTDKELRQQKWSNFKSWCSEHWKAVVTIVVVTFAVAGLIILMCIPGGGILAGIIAGACWGAITGAVIGGVSGGLMSKKNGGSFWEGFENGAFSGAIGGAIGGALTGGVTAALGPASTMMQGIVRGAATGSLSTGTSNALVTGIDFYVQNGTLNGSANKILKSGLSGLISGGIVGGIMGGVQFKFAEKAINDYTGDEYYRNINNSLRGLDKFKKASLTITRRLHNKLRKAELPNDMTLYRGTSPVSLGRLQGLPPGQLVGETITEEAFMSTSSSFNVSNGSYFNNGLVYTINVPKGAHGMDIAAKSQISSECEILFDYGQELFITGAKYIGKTLYLNVDLILK